MSTSKKNAEKPSPKGEEPSSPGGFPVTDETRALEAAGRELIAALQRFNAVIRPMAVKLSDEERRSGVGKLLDGEAAQLVKVARVALDNPSLVKGFAAKDGGIDPKVFEGEHLANHLAVHEVARGLLRQFEHESGELSALLGDLAIHRGTLARPVLLGAYRLFATMAEHDADVRNALASVLDFFDHPLRRTPKDDAPKS